MRYIEFFFFKFNYLQIHFTIPNKKMPKITKVSPKIIRVLLPQNDIILLIIKEVIKATKDSTDIINPILKKFKLYFSEAKVGQKGARIEKVKSFVNDKIKIQ